MCSRFTITFTIQEVETFFGIKKPNIRLEFRPNYNVAPSQQVPVIFNENDELIFDSAKWGLIPHWAKDDKMAYSMINARAESVAEKPSYKDAFEHGRCLIPASGFIEWEKSGSKKIPHYFSLKDMPIFAFAGIMSDWKNPDTDNIIKTCSIITTSANKTVGHIHDRMPVVLPKDSQRVWLSKKTTAESLKGMLVPYPDDSFKETILSTRINSPRVNDKVLLEPVSGDKQQRLF